MNSSCQSSFSKVRMSWDTRSKSVKTSQEQYSPKRTSQQKLFKLLQKASASPYQTNRILKNCNIAQEKQTNRKQKPKLGLKQHHYSMVDQKINDLFNKTKCSQNDSFFEDEQMKKNLHLIQKVNWLENEKGELKESVNDKEQQIKNLSDLVKELQKEIQKLKEKLLKYECVENQVWELEKYCNTILQENQSLKNKLKDEARCYSPQQSFLKNSYVKCTTLEKSLMDLGDKFAKCTKITQLLFNKEDAALDLFVQHLRKQNSSSICDLEVNSQFLNEEQGKNGYWYLEWEKKLMDTFAYGDYIAKELAQQCNQTLNLICQRYIISLNDLNSNFF